MKHCLFLLAILFSSMTAWAQEQFKRDRGSELSVGADFAFPIGDFSNSHKVGYGGTLKYAYYFTNELAFVFQTGFIQFIDKQGENGAYSYKYAALKQVPIKTGVRVSFNELYFEPQIGVSLLSSNGASTSAFTYSGTIGAMVTHNVDLGFKYERMSDEGTISLIGVRLAYLFLLK